MRTLDRNKPYTVTYGPDVASIPFFQNGLYYNNKGELVDNTHNRLRFRAMQLPFPGDEAPVGPPAATGSEDPPPPPAGSDDPLAGKSAAQIFAIAQRIRAQLDVSEDSDNFVPTVGDADGNHAFVVRHLKGPAEE